MNIALCVQHEYFIRRAYTNTHAHYRRRIIAVAMCNLVIFSPQKSSNPYWSTTRIVKFEMLRAMIGK